MRHANIAGAVERNVASDDAHEASQFTPAAFFKDAGAIIAVCLGLGLLMQVLLR
jgi:hypothetical protein